MACSEQMADLLSDFVNQQGAGLCLIDGEQRRIVCADPLALRYLGAAAVGCSCYESLAGCAGPCANCPELAVEHGTYEWEMLRPGNPPHLFRLRYTPIELENRSYRICQIMDISDYVGLSSEIISYMLLFKQLSAFQTDMLKHLGDDFPQLLSLIREHWQADRLLLLRRRQDGIRSYLFGSGGYHETPVFLPEEVAPLFQTAERMLQPVSALPTAMADRLSGGGAAPIETVALFIGHLSDEDYALVLTNMRSYLQREDINNTMLQVVRMYVENEILRENIIRDSEMDRLTGLYNHSKYLACLEQEFQGGPGFGVLYFDLDDLKYVNDHFGHTAGDQLLRQAAASIRAITDQQRICGFRIGGDEFAVVVPDSSLEELERLMAVWREACQSLASPPCAMSAGLALGGKGESAISVLRRADAAMYLDKKEKKSLGAQRAAEQRNPAR